MSVFIPSGKHPVTTELVSINVKQAAPNLLPLFLCFRLICSLHICTYLTSSTALQSFHSKMTVRVARLSAQAYRFHAYRFETTKQCQQHICN